MLHILYFTWFEINDCPRQAEIASGKLFSGSTCSTVKSIKLAYEISNFEQDCLKILLLLQYNKTNARNVSSCLLYFIAITALLFSLPLFREGCRGSSSRLSRHTSRSSINSIISLGRSPKRFHPRSSM